MKRETSQSMNCGYTLLFAVLTASLVLGVAVFILSVSRKQYILSVTARESTYSIYAADSGIECASAPNNVSSSTEIAGSMQCNGQLYSVGPFVGDASLSGYTEVRQSPGLVIHLGESGQTQGVPCAVLTFTTGRNGDGVPTSIVDSRGYNICDQYGPDSSSPRIVERALRLTNVGVW